MFLVESINHILNWNSKLLNLDLPSSIISVLFHLSHGTIYLAISYPEPMFTASDSVSFLIPPLLQLSVWLTPVDDLQLRHGLLSHAAGPTFSPTVFQRFLPHQNYPNIFWRQLVLPNLQTRIIHQTEGYRLSILTIGGCTCEQSVLECTSQENIMNWKCPKTSHVYTK